MGMEPQNLAKVVGHPFFGGNGRLGYDAAKSRKTFAEHFGGNSAVWLIFGKTLQVRHD